MPETLPQTLPATTRILVADDHALIRRGLREVIEEAPDLQVVAEAGDGEAALALMRQHQPHVAVIDIDMPKRDGFAVATEARDLPHPPEIVFLTMHNRVELVDRAIALGARGYLLKDSALTEIVQCIRSVLEGRAFITPTLAAALFSRRSRVQTLRNSLPAELTPAEWRVLHLVAQGKATKEIAGELNVHPRTVETHRASICAKLNLSGMNALLRWALDHKSELLG